MEKKKQIIECAMKLLIKNGPQAAPMSAISKEAGVGMGTIYNYFVTKEDLINQIYVFIKSDQVKNIQHPLSHLPIKHQFDIYYESLIQYFVDNPLYFQYLDQFHNAPVLTEKTRKHGNKSMSFINDLLICGQEQGLIKPIGVKEMIQFLNGGLMSFVRWIHYKNIQLNRMLITNQLQIAWDAVKINV
ncbi:TetR/AcrR family transcriptional regulator [Dyadobacter subterraneus]|uniref:TetR/AcrR family transcriptional regulator n=1 Tax=Dyadobacter subterraneus TaxID=2773304 RepID=A0ABR9WM91_9BACT|nr:TetR/AcrR family transcriptional regulator [Dyadobacter subterraneus]MBE9466648.1 TetR/AcrR family transcriptional regulator [Dyadobacter subterraneus]